MIAMSTELKLGDDRGQGCHADDGDPIDTAKAPTCRLCGQPLPTSKVSVTAAEIESLYRQDLRIDLAALGCTPSATRFSLLQCPACHLRQFFPDWVAPPAVYSALQAYPWYYQSDKSEFRVCAHHIRPGHQVLEVGCGSGKLRRHLPSSVSYTGLESNPKALAQAQASGLDVKAMDLSSVAEEQPGHFDAVLALQVLEHVTHPHEFLQCMVDCARPGGLVIVSVPAEDGFVGREVNNVLNLPPHHCTRWPDATLAQLPARLGLEAVALVSEALAPGHRRSVAIAAVMRGIVWLTGRGSPPLVMLSHQRWMRRALSAVAMPLRGALRLWPGTLRGHTVTIVMRKPGPFGG
jgi:SAM-dependent methyltransferase